MGWFLTLMVAVCPVVASPSLASETSRATPPEERTEAMDPGERVAALSRSFGDPDWHPESDRTDSGGAFWRSSGKRGLPQVMEVVPAPQPFLPGQDRALRLRTRWREDGSPGQDDLVTVRHKRIAPEAPLLRADRPTLVARVHVPPLEDLKAPYSVLGIRIQAASSDLAAYPIKPDVYYPSIWVYQVPGEAHSYLKLRVGDGYAQDVRGPDLEQGPGWYTLAIAFDGDGVGHYYCAKGLELPPEQDAIRTTDDFPGGTGARMDRIDYHFLSLGAPPGGALSADFLIGDLSWYRRPLDENGGNDAGAEE